MDSIPGGGTKLSLPHDASVPPKNKSVDDLKGRLESAEEKVMDLNMSVENIQTEGQRGKCWEIQKRW